MGDLTMDFLRLMLMAAMLLTSLQGQAADEATAPAPTTHEVEFLRSADKACTDCHKEQVEGDAASMARRLTQQPGAGHRNQLPWSALPNPPEGGQGRDAFSDSFNDKQSAPADKAKRLGRKAEHRELPHRRAERGLHELSRAQNRCARRSGPTTCTPPSSPAPAATSCTRPRSPWWLFRRSPASSSASTASSSIRPRQPTRLPAWARGGAMSCSRRHFMAGMSAGPSS